MNPSISCDSGTFTLCPLYKLYAHEKNHIYKKWIVQRKRDENKESRIECFHFINARTDRQITELCEWVSMRIAHLFNLFNLKRTILEKSYSGYLIEILFSICFDWK